METVNNKELAEPKTLQELYSKPNTWTQRATARNEKGKSCEIDNGIKFCLNGALSKVYRDDGMQRTVAYYKISKFLGMGIIQWNDWPGRTIEEVRDLVKRVNV